MLKYRLENQLITKILSVFAKIFLPALLFTLERAHLVIKKHGLDIEVCMEK